jgi:1-acyl-sn-glycerol-3-phosphate acyltransferase
MRAIPVFIGMILWKYLCLLLYRFDAEWVGEIPQDRWAEIRILAVLNHTSLWEPILLAVVPNRVIWQLARDSVVPIASKTMERPGAGWAFRFAGRRVISVSRKRDVSWEEVLRHCCGPRAVTVIFPEGRMLRRTGLDVDGKPMTVRAGIAELVAAVPEGRMLLAYSGGLHHVAAPGDRIPRIFRRVALRLETVDLHTLRANLGGPADPEFRRRVVEDLTQRRNRYSPVMGPTIPSWAVRSDDL